MPEMTPGTLKKIRLSKIKQIASPSKKRSEVIGANGSNKEIFNALFLSPQNDINNTNNIVVSPPQHRPNGKSIVLPPKAGAVASGKAKRVVRLAKRS